MIFGSLVYTQTLKFSDVTQASAAPAGFIIGLGALVCAISFFGSCGALTESYCLLMTFSWMVAVIIVAETVSVGLVYKYRNNIQDATVNGMTQLMSDYYSNNSSKIIIDEIQRDLKCCGAKGPLDWSEVENGGPGLPDSCCEKSLGEECTARDAYRKSCRGAIEQLVVDNIHALIGISATFLAVQVTSLIMACSLARSTRKDYYRFV